MQLTHLQTRFPKEKQNNALTGVIPMAYFKKNESSIRKMMSADNLRLYYRGKREPRKDGMPKTYTKRGDATGVVLYNKSVIASGFDMHTLALICFGAVLGSCFGAVLGACFVHILVYMMDSPAAGVYSELFTMTWGN